VGGGKSQFIKPEYHEKIHAFFPNAKIEMIPVPTAPPPPPHFLLSLLSLFLLCVTHTHDRTRTTAHAHDTGRRSLGALREAE
jgi:hypothetical protein